MSLSATRGARHSHKRAGIGDSLFRPTRGFGSKACWRCWRSCSSRNSYCLLPIARCFSSGVGHNSSPSNFSAARFHSAETFKWLQCLEDLAAKSGAPPPTAAISTTSGGASTSRGPSGLGAPPAPATNRLCVQGGFGWGPGALPHSLLLWRAEERLQRLSAGQLIRVAAALQQLGLRDCPSLGLDTPEANKDVALLILLQLHRQLRRSLRCLSLREIAKAAKLFSTWHFTTETTPASATEPAVPETAAAETKAAEAHRRQQGKQRGPGKASLASDPLRLRASTYRLLVASLATQLRSLGLQEHKPQRGAFFLLQLLHACSRLQLTELRGEYLLLLPLLEHHVQHTKSLLQVALLLHCCTRLLLLDAAVYRQLLQRLAEWPEFEVLLQQEEQPAAAQVALGQLALCSVAFAPWQMETLEAALQHQEEACSHHCNSSNTSNSNSSASGDRSLSQLQEAVLLNVFRAAAISVQWPSLYKPPSYPAAAGTLAAAGTPAVATTTAAATTAASTKVEDQRLKALGPPSAFLLRQLQTAAFAIRHEHPSLSSLLEVPTRHTQEKARKWQIRKLILTLLETAFAIKTTEGPRRGRSNSEQHANVGAALEAVGVAAEKEARVGPYEADLLLPEFRCIIEIDGPLHFLRPPSPRYTSTSSTISNSSSHGRRKSATPASLLADPSSSSSGCFASANSRGIWGPLTEGTPVLVYDVKSSLKHRLMKASGWEVLHIAWNDWPRDRHNQHRALAQLLRQTKQQRQQQQPEPPEGGGAWAGCGGTLLVYKPQFGILLSNEGNHRRREKSGSPIGVIDGIQTNM